MISCDEALEMIDQISRAQNALRPLTRIQITVFRYCWEDKSYQAIADSLGYEYGYVKKVGFYLWRRLSQIMQERISKSNIRATLGRYRIRQENLRPA